MRNWLCIFCLFAGISVHAGEPEPRLVLDVPRAGADARNCTYIGPLRRLRTRPVTLRRTFHDGFDAFDIGDGKWTPHFDHNPYDDWRARTLSGNNEMQIYVDPGYKGTSNTPLGLSPFSVADGVLTITAEKTDNRHLGGFDFTSGVITTRKSLLQRHGYFEIRARMPKGQGLWPAFWMLAPGKWPPEIDVVEFLGHDPDRIHMHVHWLDGKTHIDVGCKLKNRSATYAFHSYGVLWTEDVLVRYIDRVPVAVTATPPGMDDPMYMLVNLAVGGDWPGPPDDRTPFPAKFDIDWVAAYQIEGGP